MECKPAADAAPEEPCHMLCLTLTKQLENIDRQLAALKESQDSVAESVGTLQRSQDSVAKSVGTLKESQDSVAKSVGVIDERLSSIASWHSSPAETRAAPSPRQEGLQASPSFNSTMQSKFGGSEATSMVYDDGVHMAVPARGREKKFSSNSLQSSPSLRAQLQVVLRHNRKLQTGSSSSSEATSSSLQSVSGVDPRLGPRLSSLAEFNRPLKNLSDGHAGGGVARSLAEARNLAVASSNAGSEKSKTAKDNSTASSNAGSEKSKAAKDEAAQAESRGSSKGSSKGSGGRRNSNKEPLARELSLGEDHELFTHMTSRAYTQAGQPASRFLLIPGTMWCFVLDVLTVWAVVMTGLAVPIGLAYHRNKSLSSGVLGALLCTVDVIWILYIVASFRTAFFKRGHVEMGTGRIASRYVQSWLLCDLMSVWPLVATFGENDVVMVLGLLKMLRLLKLGPLFIRMKNFSASTTLYPVVIAVLALMVCNLLTCGWRAVQNGSDFAELETEWSEKYVKDIYFIMMVMSTVGFGDIYPHGTGQRLYGIFTMVIAPLIFGAVVTLLGNVMDSLFNDKVTAQVSRALRFMKNRQVPQELQRRVHHNLRRNALQDNKMTLAPDLLAQLSPALQRELLSELLRSTVLQFPLFKFANSAFVGEIAQAHTWVHCLPGDIVLEEGQLMQEIVFVIRGQLMMMGGCELPGADANVYEVEPEVNKREDVEINAGAWFGEVSLFEDDRACETSVVAVIESELAVLEASNFHLIISHYPRVLQRHQQIIANVRAERLDLDRFAYCGGSTAAEDAFHTKPCRLFQGLCNRIFPTTRSGSVSSIMPATD